MATDDLFAGTLSWGSSFNTAFFNPPGFCLQFWPIIFKNACHCVLFKKDHKLVYKVSEKYQRKNMTVYYLKIKTEYNA